MTKKNKNNNRGTEVEDNFMADNLTGKITEDFDLAIEKINDRPINFNQYPNLEKVDRSLQTKVQFVLRRVNLAHSLLDDDIVKWINATNETYELSSLRNYLLLSCVNLLGEVSRIEAPLSFLSWLDTSHSLTIRSIREEAVNKAISSVGSVDDQAKAIKLIKSVFAQYKLNNSIESNFFAFFTDAADSDLQNWISSNCWIYQDNPLEKWANLQNVREGYSNIASPENKRLSSARKRWDGLDSFQRLFEISQFLENLFNQYNLCVVNPPVEFEKDPISKVWKDIDQAVNDYKLNYLSNSLFNHLGAEGQKFKFNEVKCVYKDDELYVLESDMRDKDRDVWLKRLSEWIQTKIDSGKSAGETIFLHQKNQALVIPDKNLSDTLEEWIDKSVKNILTKKQI